MAITDEDAAGFWHPRYLTSRMAQRIRQHTYIGTSAFSGRGMFASNNIERGKIVGYFSGPVLNAATWETADEDYISYARWTHPDSGNTHSYFFEVRSPSKYMNGGIHPQYLPAPVKIPMQANVGLSQATYRIAGRYRPVLVLKTLAAVNKGQELLLDYGVLHDSIYYEYLRRQKRKPGRQAALSFDAWLHRQYQLWRESVGYTGTHSARYNETYLQALATSYFAEGQKTVPLVADPQATANSAPLYIGPRQTPIAIPRALKAGKYYLSSPTVVFDQRLSQSEMANIPWQYLPLAVASRKAVSKTHLDQLKTAVDEMSEGPWESVYLPTRPGHGNNSGNGMSGSFFQRADLEVTIEPGITSALDTTYHWPAIKSYASRYRVQPGRYNYSLVYHHYRSAFESAFNLFIRSVALLDKRLKHSLLECRRVGLYCGVTDYYGDPDQLPNHLLQQALSANPNPQVIDRRHYLDVLKSYRHYPVLPGNYHTDGIEKNLDVQGVFTIYHQQVKGGETLLRRRGIRHRYSLHRNATEQPDITVRLECPEGHTSLWVPGWGNTEVEHTPGPLQGGHRTILVLGLDTSEFLPEYDELQSRRFFGSHNETLSWDRRKWWSGGESIRTPDSRLWDPAE